MAVDLDRLAALGKRRRKLLDDLEGVADEIHALIATAAVEGVPQVRLVELTGYTRETIRKICLSAERAEAENQARRERRRQPTTPASGEEEPAAASKPPAGRTTAAPSAPVRARRGAN